MKKGLLKLLSAVFAPVPYPAAAGWHAIAGSAIVWAFRGAPRSYSATQLLTGLAISLGVGLAAVLIIHVLDEQRKPQ